MGWRVPIWKKNFCSRVLWLSELPKCNERPQIAICCLEWLGKLKCLATGFNASLSFLSTSRRCSLKRSFTQIRVNVPVFRKALLPSFYRSSGSPHRQSSLQMSQKEHSDRIPFTLTFHPHNHSVKSIILKNFKLGFVATSISLAVAFILLKETVYALVCITNLQTHIVTCCIHLCIHLMLKIPFPFLSL